MECTAAHESRAMPARCGMQGTGLQAAAPAPRECPPFPGDILRSRVQEQAVFPADQVGTAVFSW